MEHQTKDGADLPARAPYRVEDLQKMTGESAQTIREAARAGRIKGAYKIGKAWLFAPQRIDRLLNGEIEGA
jgi:hypothetical protein